MIKDFIEFEISKDHIDEGERHSLFNSPVALALKSKGYSNVKVRPRQVEMCGEVWDSDKSLESFLLNFNSFDRSYAKPGTYRISNPRPAMFV